MSKGESITGEQVMKREGEEASVSLKGLKFSGQQTGCGGSVILSANARALLANK